MGIIPFEINRFPNDSMHRLSFNSIDDSSKSPSLSPISRDPIELFQFSTRSQLEGDLVLSV